MAFLIALLLVAGDERKSVEAVCPVDGTRFPAIEVTATNHWGGRDADGCPHAFRTTPLELRVWVCPGCLYAGRKGDFGVAVTAEEKAALKEGLKAPQPVAKGAKQEAVPGWVKYDLMAQAARIRKQPANVMALAWQHAAWSARQQGATDFQDFDEWEALKGQYSLTQTPMQYGLAKNRADLDLEAARKIDKDLAAKKFERGPSRILARYLSAYLWRKHGELAEAEAALGAVEGLKGENSIVDDAAARMRASLIREREYLGKAREGWKAALEEGRLGKSDTAQATYLVGELSRLLGELQEAAQWLQKAIDLSGDLPPLLTLAKAQKARLP